MLRELNEFFRKRAEIEATYSRSLDKLARVHASRQRALQSSSSNNSNNSNSNNSNNPVSQSDSEGSKELNAAKRSEYTTSGFWTESIASARRTAVEHAALGELFDKALASRCLDLADGSQRVAKHWRVAVNEAYEQTLRNVNDLQFALRSYHNAYAEYSSAGVKLNDWHARGDRIANQVSLRLAKRKHSEPLAGANDLGASFVQRTICGTSNLPAQQEPEEQYVPNDADDANDSNLPDADSHAPMSEVMLRQVGTSMQKKVKAFERELGKVCRTVYFCLPYCA